MLNWFLDCKKNENKQKETGIGPFVKKILASGMGKNDFSVDIFCIFSIGR